MIKLAASTLGCPDWDFDEVMHRYAEYGIEGIEIRGIDGEMEAEKIARFLPENVEKTTDALKEKKLAFVSFGTSVCLHAKEDRAALIEYIGKTAEVCCRVGIPSIRVFGDKLPEESGFEREMLLARIIGNFAAVLNKAAEFGISVNLEVHGNINSCRNLSPIIEGVKHIPNFGIIWDVEHSDRETGDDFLPFFELIKPYLKHVHFKDYYREKDGQKNVLTDIGHGDIPLAKIVRVLQESGYNGYISLEWEKRWHPELASPEQAFPEFVSFMKKLGVGK